MSNMRNIPRPSSRDTSPSPVREPVLSSEPKASRLEPIIVQQRIDGSHPFDFMALLAIEQHEAIRNPAIRRYLSETLDAFQKFRRERSG
ncbi:MAG: hypothetical protein NHB36_08270 [Nitrospira sp.]|nr:hypothetical protein [Nitrospira sp.]